MRNWIWKGRPHAPASVEAVVKIPLDGPALRHRIEFAASDRRFTLVDETIRSDQNLAEAHLFYQYYGLGGPVVSRSLQYGEREEWVLEAVAPDESILSQRKDPDQFPELTALSRFCAGINLYREWALGRNAFIRQSQRTDVRPAPLQEDFSNLGMLLSRIRQYPKTKATRFEKLEDIYEGVTDFELNFEGGRSRCSLRRAN